MNLEFGKTYMVKLKCDAEVWDLARQSGVSSPRRAKSGTLGYITYDCDDTLFNFYTLDGVWSCGIPSYQIRLCSSLEALASEAE